MTKTPNLGLNLIQEGDILDDLVLNENFSILDESSGEQKRDADLRTYPVKAGETVQAGDVVDVVGGSVGSSLIALPNVESVLTGSIQSIGACAISTGVCVVLSMDTNINPVTDILRIENGKIKQYRASGDLSYKSYNYLSIERLSDTKFAAAYMYSNALYAKIGVLSGDDVTFGSECTLSSANAGYNTLIQLSEYSFLSVYNATHLRARVCTVSGTAITPGTEYALPGSTNAAYISATRLPDLNGNKRVCVCYSDGADGNKGKAVIATISTSNVVTWGTPVVFNSGNTIWIDCCADGQDVGVAYSTNNIGYAKILPISGSAITTSAPACTTGGSVTAYNQIRVVNSKLILAVRNANVGKVAVLVRTGDVLQKGQDWFFNLGADAIYLSMTPTDDERFIISYADVANSSYGTATLLEVRGDQIAGGFENTSSQAIALTSAASGQPCEVIFDGTAPAPWATEGMEITSPGVRGYCPRDGWIWVRPEWDAGAKVVTGTYIGTGTYGSSNPNTLTFDFVPKIVIVYDIKQPTSGLYPGSSGWSRSFLWTPLVPKTLVSGKGVVLNQSGKTLSWYSDNADSQLNQGNSLYYSYAYIAIG